MKKLISILVLIGAIISPIFIQAHVKWFTELEPQKENIEAILSPLFLVISIAVAFILAVLPQLLPIMMRWEPLAKIDKKLDGFRRYSRHILKYGTAVALIIQVTSGTLFAPEFHIPSNVITILTWNPLSFY